MDKERSKNGIGIIKIQNQIHRYINTETRTALTSTKLIQKLNYSISKCTDEDVTLDGDHSNEAMTETSDITDEQTPAKQPERSSQALA